MTTPTPDDAPTTRKAARLAEATEERDAIAADLAAARDIVTALKVERDRIAAEMAARLMDAHGKCQTIAADLADAEDLVKALTPRTRKPRTVQTAEQATAALLAGDSVIVQDDETTVPRYEVLGQ